MKQLLRRLALAFGVGSAFAAGALALMISVASIQAATVALFTGPGGTNATVEPRLVGDYNQILASLNANAAFAGNAAPSLVLGTSLTSSSSKFSNTQQNILQFVNSGTFTSTTNTAGGCLIANATVCFGVIDPNGFIRWIPAS